MKIAVILGTRPEIMKVSPIIRELEKRKIKHIVIHTGQHYSHNLDQIFFNDLKLKKPDYNIHVGSKSSPTQIGLMMIKMEKILREFNPDVVLVPGDTQTALGGALTARKLNMKIGHVEAGLRSYDESMPEEWNRRMIDHCSDYMFAPTNISRDILLGEGISKKRIFVTGNTIVDAVQQSTKIAELSTILKKLNLISKQYVLVSIHRQENVSDTKKLKNLIKSLKIIQKEFSIPVIFPIHPRTKKAIKDLKIDLKNITVIEPIGYLDFLHLQKNSKLVLTDSGGIQEETTILKIPCVTLRHNTERPESVHVGANIIAGTSPEKILKCAKIMIKRKRNWRNPFGNGKTAKKIVDILLKHHN